MVPNLRRIVEDAGFARIANRRLDDVLKTSAFEVSSTDQFVELVDIGSVMLPVVKDQGLGGNMWIQCVW